MEDKLPRSLLLPYLSSGERECVGEEVEMNAVAMTVVGEGLAVASAHHSHGGERREWASSFGARRAMLRSQHLSFLQPFRLHFSPPQSRRQAKLRAQSTERQFFLHHLVASMGADVEQSYIMIKPDGVQRGLVGEIISRFEKKGFLLKGLKLFQCPKELAEEHYKDLKTKSFYPKLIEYITSGPVVCMAWEGVGVVLAARKLIGATNPLEAEAGTIRGDLAVQTGRNVVHGSDSPENGKRELALWFNEGELCQWSPAQAPWLWE